LIANRRSDDRLDRDEIQITGLDKPANERGYYLNPDLYGQHDEKQIEWGRFSAKMKYLKEMPATRFIDRNSERNQESSHVLKQLGMGHGSGCPFSRLASQSDDGSGALKVFSAKRKILFNFRLPY
jgi:hypothetical protein